MISEKVTGETNTMMIKLGKKEEFVYSLMESDLRVQIQDGTLGAGEKLLSEHELVRKYKISRRSVRQALQNLAKENLIKSCPGRGCFVAERTTPSIKSRCTIVLLLSDVDDSFIIELNKGVQEAAKNLNCNLIFQSSHHRHKTERENIFHWLNSKVDGLILFPLSGSYNADAIFELKKSNLPFVLLDRFFTDIDTDYVIVDNYAGGFDAVSYLTQRGHRKIAHLMGSRSSSNRARYEGYRDALAAAGIVYDPNMVVRMPTDFVSNNKQLEQDVVFGENAMETLLKTKPYPTAVFACNDNMAIGAMRALREKGLRVPEDIAVIGFDDLKISSMLEVPLTTVRQPKEEIGKQAVNLLFQRIQEREKGIAPSVTSHIVLKTTLVKRKSG